MLTWALLARAALACSCGYSLSDDLAFEQADVVFRGRLSEIGSPEEGAFDYTVSLRFDVAAWWKGPGDAEATVRTSWSGATCGLEDLAVGQVWVIYASLDHGALWTGLCTRSTEAVSREVGRLGEPTHLRKLAPARPSALHAAVLAGDADAARAAIAAGGNPNARLPEGLPIRLRSMPAT